MNTEINSVVDEDVATMLPTVGLNGEVLTKNNILDTENVDNVEIPNDDKKIESEDESMQDIEFNEAVLDYMSNLDVTYDAVVEEGVGKIVDKIKERAVVSSKTCKLVVDIYILKKRIKRANKKDDDGLVIDMKRDLIQKQKELSEIKRTSSPELQKEISKIEKNLEKNTPNIDIDDLKTESCGDELMIEGVREFINSIKEKKKFKESNKKANRALEAYIKLYYAEINLKVMDIKNEYLVKELNANKTDISIKDLREQPAYKEAIALVSNNKDILTNIISTLSDDEKVGYNELKAQVTPQLKELEESYIKNADDAYKQADDASNIVNVKTEAKISDENVIIEKEDDDKTLPPELKRLDEIRGQIENLSDDLEKAKEQLAKTGEKLYENKVKGLTAKIDKLKKELSEKEKEAKKIQGDDVKESTDMVIEAHAVSLDGRINYWREMVKAVEGKIQEKLNLLKKTTFAGTIKKLENEIMELKHKLNDCKKNLNKLLEQKSGGSVAYASTDDVDFDCDVITEAADMEDEIKPIVSKLESKGYQVKYASPGHKQLRKKEDAQPDGVYYGKLYSDARIMFDKKYSFSDAPKYWHWRDVDNCSYLDISPIAYNKNDGTPDEAFAKWKENYMNSLKTFVDGLKDNSEKDVKESVDEFAYSFMEEMFEKMGINDLDNSGFLVNESVAVDTSKNLIEELDNLLA